MSENKFESRGGREAVGYDIIDGIQRKLCSHCKNNNECDLSPGDCNVLTLSDIHEIESVILNKVFK